MKRKLACFLMVVVLFSCAKQEVGIKIEVVNGLSIDRNNEVVYVAANELGNSLKENMDQLRVFDGSGSVIISQIVDQDLDGMVDGLLFQSSVRASSSKTYEVKLLKAGDIAIETESTCFSRFVPERTDDYAWENDKVAFRTFGPTAQKMIADGIPGGTLSSGIDCWLKKVDYPIIDKWYGENDADPGAYHRDSGEGLDNFHVGASRGCGGIAARDQSGKFYFSKNFYEWKNIENGPLRTSFKLGYENWDMGESKISEVKNVSLEQGSHFTKYEVQLVGTEDIYAGLTLHEKDGQVTINDDQGWVSYWQPHGDAYLGTAIIAAPGYFMSGEEFITEEKDLSNAYMQLKVTQQSTTYYAGFVWSETGQITNQSEWEQYVGHFAMLLKMPLIVTIKK